MGGFDERFLERIINAVADPLFVKDEDHRWILMNDAMCEFMGYPREALIGRSDYDFFPKDQADVFWAKDELVFRTGQSNINEESFTDADGRVHTISTKKSVFQDSSGKKILVGIIRDMTAQKTLERELITAREAAVEGGRAKSAFLANMSHEIRTPMNGVIGMTQILLGTPLTDEQKEVATIIKKSGEHLLSIINEILDFSKIEAGKVRLETIDFNVRETVEQVIDVVAPRAMEKEIELACFVDPRLPSLLCGDPARLTEILLNLMGNAIKFTDRGAVVLRVRLSELDAKEARVLFEVEDSGIGIAPNDLHDLFEAFFQVDASATRKYGGTGLGLAITRQLVEMMHGRIEVKSAPGEGSAFSFVITLGTASERGPEPLGLPPVLESRRALVIDPHQRARTVLAEQLEALGLRTTSTEDVPSAMALVDNRSEPFALIVCDTLAAGASELLSSLRAKDVPPRVAWLTALGTHRQAIVDSELRTVAISKPVIESRLLAGLWTLFEPTTPTRVVETRSAPMHGERSVLVVEDNLINQRVTQSLLESLGYRVALAGDGQEALSVLRKNRDLQFAAILMDLQMPGMDGYSAAREIRSFKDQRRLTPIIAMSASALEEDRTRALAAGMDDYVTKPVQVASLRAKLAQWIR